jgi:hypothetical protein
LLLSLAQELSSPAAVRPLPSNGRLLQLERPPRASELQRLLASGLVTEMLLRLFFRERPMPSPGTMASLPLLAPEAPLMLLLPRLAEEGALAATAAHNRGAAAVAGGPGGSTVQAMSDLQLATTTLLLQLEPLPAAAAASLAQGPQSVAAGATSDGACTGGCSSPQHTPAAPMGGG